MRMILLVAVFAIIISFVFPTVVPDIYIGIYFIFSIIFFLKLLYIKNIALYKHLPVLLFIYSCFITAINFSVFGYILRYIFKTVVEFNILIIKIVSRIVVGSGNNMHFILGTICFFGLITIIALYHFSGAKLISKSKDKQDVNFYSAIEGAFRFYFGTVKIMICIAFLIVIIGVLVNTVIHKEPLFSVLKIYTSLTIGYGVVFMLPYFLVSFGLMRHFTTKREK